VEAVGEQVVGLARRRARIGEPAGGEVLLYLAAEHRRGDERQRGNGEDAARMADAEVGESGEHGRPSRVRGIANSVNLTVLR